MKTIALDSGPVISLALNGILRILDPLKEKLDGDFVVTPAVRRELIDRPIETKRFSFEALRVLRYMRSGAISLVDSYEVKTEADKLMDIANKIFQAKGQWMKIVHYAEIETLAYAIVHKADAIVIDERTTRMLIENPEGLEVRLSKKLHTTINVNKSNIAEFQRRTKDIKVIRSVELVTAAFELGLLNEYLPENLSRKEAEHLLLNSLIWGLKLNGCAISDDEIKRIEHLVKSPPESI